MDSDMEIYVSLTLWRM